MVKSVHEGRRALPEWWFLSRVLACRSSCCRLAPPCNIGFRKNTIGACGKSCKGDVIGPREISQRPMRTGTYGKKEVHFGEIELASFSEWKSNGDFGGRGQQNDSSNQARQVALLDHLNSPGVREIAGTWGPSRVKHVVDPVTRRCVVLIERGQSFEFKRGLQLSNDQMERLLKTGKLP